MNSPISPVAEVDQVFLFIIGISFFFLFLVTGLMIFFVIKYRRAKHPVAADIRGNWLLETIWMVIPTAIALAMFYYGWAAYLNLRAVPPNAIEIDVQGQMFSWIFIYPNDKITENDLVVPVGKPIKLNITSTDVLHGLFIPAYRVKIDAVPGMKTYAWFYADKIGNFNVLCTEFCGSGHSNMTADLRIVSEEEYETWLEEDDDDD